MDGWNLAKPIASMSFIIREFRKKICLKEEKKIGVDIERAMLDCIANTHWNISNDGDTLGSIKNYLTKFILRKKGGKIMR